MSNKTNKDIKVIGEVRIVGLISGNWSDSKEFLLEKYPIPQNYLCNSELPKELITLCIENGWTDKDGNVFFPEDFQPEPMLADDGNVYLLANDKTPKEDLLFDYVDRGYQLLKQSESA